jgi:flagellar motor switch protein FliN/FliY
LKTYLECWTAAAKSLFSQALAGEPELSESPLSSMTAEVFGFSATLAGDQAGNFSVLLDAGLLALPLVGEGLDQKAGWGELLREVADAAAGELLAATGNNCRVARFEEIGAPGKTSCAFQLQLGERAWGILVLDEVRNEKSGKVPARPSTSAVQASPASPPSVNPGIELLLDIELEASLRFGCREMPLGQILDLGPGDVVQLDRHVADPVDLVVGDKIVARGEVVLVNGNFGLRVTEVAAPRKRLESIRCLF